MKNRASPNRSLCVVVPAAGQGSRLGADVPKVFVLLLSTFTIWDAIHEKILPLADRIVLILSPQGRNFLEKNKHSFPAKSFAKTEWALQPEPLGMGDAIFGAVDLWHEFDDLLVVWGDQFNLSGETLRACLELHRCQPKPALTLPVVRTPKPYVEYVFNAGRLTAVKQSREGDLCASGGFSDLGVFLLSGGESLTEEWKRYRSMNDSGAMTGEINFLPFLVHLSLHAGWSVGRHESLDPLEALGINTNEDLALARELLRKKSASAGGPL
jgi:bifunctional UDP-N-acetylglucosamine pyrophosphorylase/glucosamine-1-phosphate N-acetyltransferase